MNLKGQRLFSGVGGVDTGTGHVAQRSGGKGDGTARLV
jgi:hypothetical protein